MEGNLFLHCFTEKKRENTMKEKLLERFLRYVAVTSQSNAKAGVDNLTKWLAVEFAKKIGEGVRVNAVAPGFFISSQNRSLLTNPDGSLTSRGKDIVRKTPFGRFGEPEEVFGAVRFLCSDAAKFITGTVLPIDGGFSCFSGV